MFSSNMCINVEFLAGTTTEQAIIEARQKAFYMDVAYVCFDFNGVKFSVSRGAIVSEMLTKYEAITSDTKESLKIIVG